MAAKHDKAGRIRVGIAGWVFPGWRGNFYPKGLKQKDELRHAAQAFSMLEINGTFYAMQKPATFAAWAAETPEDFVFSMKGPRYITHMRRLKDCAVPLANFMASGVLRLGAKFGPVLWQLPPNMTFEADRLEAFLALLPHDREAAAALGAKHDAKLEGRAFLDPGAPGPVRHVLEVRHESFANPACIALLRRHKVALAFADGVPDWPHLRDLTADFVYARLHLSAETQGEGGYDDAAIAAWAKRAREWAVGGEPKDGTHLSHDPAPKAAQRDVFVVFDAAGDETVKRYTPVNAAALLDRLGRDA